jgi:hypothetical protein
MRFFSRFSVPAMDPDTLRLMDAPMDPQLSTTPPSGLNSFPEVMTEQEAIRYLRLDLIEIQNPGDTLAYYRRKGLLHGTQIGKCVRYRRVEIERFLDAITQSNPR